MHTSGRSRALVVVALLLATTGIMGAARHVAAAACDVWAVVVVDTGVGVHTTPICFSGTISGIDALQLAGASPETITYGSLGLAVCRLYGVGDPVLPGQCPGGWVYFRAVGGAGAWTGSTLGASNTQVHNGDVEGWKYGSGQPPFVSFCSVVGCAPPPTAPPPTATAGGSSGSGAATVPGDASATNGGSGASTASPAPAGGTGAAPATTTTVARGGSTSAGAAGNGRASSEGSKRGSVELAASGPGGGDSGSPSGVLIAAGVLAAAAVGAVVLRRRRGGMTPG